MRASIPASPAARGWDLVGAMCVDSHDVDAICDRRSDARSCRAGVGRPPGSPPLAFEIRSSRHACRIGGIRGNLAAFGGRHLDASLACGAVLTADFAGWLLCGDLNKPAMSAFSTPVTSQSTDRPPAVRGLSRAKSWYSIEIRHFSSSGYDPACRMHFLRKLNTTQSCLELDSDKSICARCSSVCILPAPASWSPPA